MAIEVLLRRSIEGVGQVGEVVRVKNGYARNYLLPKNYAAVVSPDSLRRIERDKDEEAKRQSRLAEERAVLAEKLADMRITVEARAGEDGHLYGSVGPRQVINAFLELGYEFEERQIRFEVVRELGEYEVGVNLGAEHVVPVTLWVVQDAQEALELAEKAKAAAVAQEQSEGAGPDVPAGDILDTE